MEVFVLLMSIILSSVVAHAAPSQADKDYCKMQPVQSDAYISKERKAELLALCLSNRETQGIAANLRSQVQTLKDKEQDCFKDDRGWFDRLRNKAQRVPTAEDVARCEAAAKAKQAELDKLNQTLAQQERDLAAAEAKYKADTGTATATAAQRKETDEIVKDAFTTMKMSILDQKLQGADAALKLTKMATALDNSALGLYLRERMAGVLNSPALCAAAKACSDNKKAEIKGSDLNSVFNSSMNTGVNGEREVVSSAPGGKKTEKPVGTGK